MGETTGIAWTDHTMNPWWGCTNVSPGCDNCYAETLANRWAFDVWGKDSPRRFFGDKHWNEPRRWNETARIMGRPSLVFCASMADAFEPRDDLHVWRERLWTLIEETPHLIWQLLTKRPEQVMRLVPERWWRSGFPANVWIGTTVEDQERAELRLPRLVRIPARVLFVSAEPLLGRVVIRPWLDRIQWVIVGGESGNGFRALDLGYARDVIDQCEAADVPVFFKQVGGRTPTAGGDALDGRTWKQFPPEARRLVEA